VNFVMIYGDLGVGKSHALLWSQNQILHARASEFKSLAYYIKTMMKERGKMQFGIAFEEDIVNKSNMVNDVQFFREFVDGCIVEYKRENSLGPEVNKAAVVDKMVPSMELHNLLKEILNCQTEPDVKKKILSPDGDHAAMLLFCRLTNLFVYPFQLQAGVRRFKQAVYLFIDEMDELGEISAKEAREVNGLIRHIYDQCPNCFFLGLGFTATAAEIGALFAPQVLSRVSKQIVLDYLQPEEAKLFVKDILNSARVDKKKKVDYFPFTEDAVATCVSEIVSITPRKVIDRMLQVLEECRLAGMNPSKSPIATEMLDKAKIWEMIG
jgi:polyhydroxyalkanoate synthesis regulator phasin